MKSFMHGQPGDVKNNNNNLLNSERFDRKYFVRWTLDTYFAFKCKEKERKRQIYKQRMVYKIGICKAIQNKNIGLAVIAF